MSDFSSTPDFAELASFIQESFYTLRAPYMAWANLARLALQNLPYPPQRLDELEPSINERRAELKRVILIASEHLTEEQLVLLRNQARMSKQAWKSLKKTRTVTIKNGFSLLSY